VDGFGEFLDGLIYSEIYLMATIAVGLKKAAVKRFGIICSSGIA